MMNKLFKKKTLSSLLELNVYRAFIEGDHRGNKTPWPSLV